ncbi:hypothetical protein [Prosthecobacter sp.]|uniref:hypothetical protein n=1 Tax=Prosthecobacter sp. TaxID=1965333 RepID=UPI003783F8CC
MKILLIVTVAGLLAAGSSRAADGGGVVEKGRTALSQDGGHRLRLIDGEQLRSPWDENVCAVTLHFRLEYADKRNGFVTQAPGNVFIEKVGPLEEVLLASGENVAANKHSNYCTTTSDLVVSTLELGKEQRQLKKLRLALTLVKVTEWRVLDFKGLKEGKSETLHGGPFEIECNGGAETFGVSIGSQLEFQREHEIYRKQMPLTLINHHFAMEHLEVMDFKNRPMNTRMGMFTGGSSNSQFSIRDGLDPKVAEPIAYPVNLQLKLPGKYETQELEFEFEKVDLPPLEKSTKR